jgi:hypothetical protein
MDKLEDEIDRKKNKRSEEFVNALSSAIEKLKQYYSHTGGLIYTIATGKLDGLLFYIIL